MRPRRSLGALEDVFRYAQASSGPRPTGCHLFTWKFIERTRDSNRGSMRVDMVIRRVDGGYVRIHKGSKPKSDAAPKYFPAPIGRAADHARDEWNTPGPSWTFTWGRAQMSSASR